jgi:outer membrane lipoprotein-sorting protein
MLTLLPLVSLVTLPQKPTAPPKPKPAPAQKPVAPTARPVTRPAEPAKPTTPITRTDSSALALLTTGAEAYSKLTSLEAALDWRYLGKANLSARPTSLQGQKALEAALRSAQATLTLTKDGQARLDVSAPGKDTLPRATTVTDRKQLYVLRYDNEGKLTAATERALAQGGQEKAFAANPALSQTGARQVLAALPPPVAALLLGRDPLEDARNEGRLLSVELAGTATVAGVACTAVTATLREVGLQGQEDPADARLPAHDKQRITFYLGSADKLLRQVVIENVLWGQQGSISILTFTNLKVNQPIPEGTFAFNPPGSPLIRRSEPGGFRRVQAGLDLRVEN